MKGLCAAGFTEQDDNHFFHLTPKGHRAAQSLRTRYEITKRFLTDVLGLSAQAAHLQSCQITHLVKEQTARRLAAFLDSTAPARIDIDVLINCPHGHEDCEKDEDDINGPDCAMECLSGWLPSPETRPPCQEILYDN
jgi:Mn-dependent DtxR family transcriptional regulator